LLEGIYDGEGLVLSRTKEALVSEEDVSTNNSGDSKEGDESNQLITQFLAQIELDIKPCTGFDDAKIGLMAHVRL